MRPSLRSLPAVLLTSDALRRARTGSAALRRRLRRTRPVVHYFHQVDDPYSDLAVRALPHLVTHFDIDVVPHPVPAPEPGAAPDPQRLAAWSLRDARQLAAGLGLTPPRWSTIPAPAQVRAAQCALAGVTDASGFAERAAQVGAAYAAAASDADAGRDAAGVDVPGHARGDRGSGPDAALHAGAALRRRHGHYLGAMFHFEGEWYWGLDRLPYLEQRLLPFARTGVPPRPFVARREVRLTAPAAHREVVLEAFLSLRSPYTWLAMPRLLELARVNAVRLQLRFVLPMVMRGLAVPAAKRYYIMLDCKREAGRLGMPFGRVADPVGAPAERGLAVLHRAIDAGRGAEFAVSFLRGVFAEGVDAGSDRGLLALCERAGISRAGMGAALADPDWRAAVEANRVDMLDAGLWGVPSFRVDGGDAQWGQDRLWRVEELLQEAQMTLDPR